MLLKKIFNFYYKGLTDLSPFWKNLWKLVWVKVLFLIIIAYFILPNILNEKFDNEVDKAEYVWGNILKSNN